MSDILWWTLTLFAKFPEHRKHEKITSNKLYFSFSFIQSWFYYPKLSDNFSTPAKVVLMSKLLRMEWLLFSWKRSNNGGFGTKKSQLLTGFLFIRSPLLPNLTMMGRNQVPLKSWVRQKYYRPLYILSQKCQISRCLKNADCTCYYSRPSLLELLSLWI